MLFQANGENALHLAILQENGHNLHIVDFIIQNTNRFFLRTSRIALNFKFSFHSFTYHLSQELDRQTFEGNTALHLCALEDKSECMKLLLRANPELVSQTNGQGMTALTIATERNSRMCPVLVCGGWCFEAEFDFQFVAALFNFSFNMQWRISPSFLNTSQLIGLSYK